MKMIEMTKGLIIQAAKAAIEIKEKGKFNTLLKNDGTPYTKGDELSHDILLKLEDFTGIPVLSEEMSKEKYSESHTKYKQIRKVWIIDPLDGTKEYKKGLDEYAISVALIEEGKPVLGLVYSPDRNLFLYARKGEGAFRIDHVAGLESRLKTTSVTNFKEMKLLVSSSELNEAAYPDYVNNLINLGYKIRDSKPQDSRITCLGSTTLKTAMIANGDADINFTFTAWDLVKKKLRITKEWDIAATYLLVKEAGGMMTDCSGRDFAFGKEDPKNYYGIFTSNSAENHYKLLEHITQGIDFDKIRKPQ